jgi:serine/threonine-protein kinase
MPAVDPSTESVTGLAPAVGGVSEGRFLPGVVIGGRYRMIALLGRGGMGEVYRADDLKLGQSVALKFLPADVERDPARLERFLEEVRVSLRVTHPSVCRVFDIGQVDRRHFLSMEFVDGEDLASLLRRIGRLPEGKALDIARQLCAALAAAHDQGVLHRDIKPANIMIDGRGRAKITDFGLGGAFIGVGGIEARAGTPRYMAPEQLDGGKLSERTDLYALGLVLYELFTGKSAFDVRDDDPRRARSSPPTSPSSHVSGLDPLIERAILRCLEPDPAKRPASAAVLAAALPGGDPLAMAIAAGETPSPELVAAAGADVGLSAKTVWVLCVVGLVGITTLALLTGRVALNTIGAPLKPPDVMIERAREILSTVGIRGDVVDSAFGFDPNGLYLNYAAEHRLSNEEDGPAEHGVQFWYRQAPVYLGRVTFIGPFFMAAVGPWDPVPVYSGEAVLFLNRRGQLRELLHIPPQLPGEPGPAGDADWPALFKAAGLDDTAWVSVEPRWTPWFFGDRRVAWAPRSPQPNRPERVEAASFRGVPVSFTVVYPWTAPFRDLVTTRTPGQRIADLTGILLVAAILLGSAWLARRNLRLDRADRKGAVRLGVMFAMSGLLGWLVGEHHVLAIWELELALMGLGVALVSGVVNATFYLALEPEVRRRWPGILVSWSRLVSGDVWNPLVARDVIIGCVVIAVIGSIQVSGTILGRELTGVLPWIESAPRPFMGGRQLVPALLGGLGAAASISLMLLLLFFVVRLVVRREWAAVLVCTVLLAPAALAPIEAAAVRLPVTLVYQAAIFVMLARVGLVATIAAYFVQIVLTEFPVTWPPTAWYSPAGLVGLAVVATVVIGATRIVARAQERLTRRVGQSAG